MADFRPMLAGEFDPTKAVFPLYASPKLDGIRAIIRDKTPLSRTLKVIPNKHVQAVLAHPWLEGLDGELVVGPANDANAMQATTSGVMTQEGTPTFTYWVFDVWQAIQDPFRLRWAMLEQYQEQLESVIPEVKVLGQALLQSQNELDLYEKWCLEQGFEGVMTRSPEGVYKYGRSTTRQGYLLKVKRFVDAEAEIIGFEEQMENGNKLQKDELGYAKRSSHQDNMIPKGTLGAFICRNLSDNVVFRVGTGRGLTAVLRQMIWDNREKFLGKIIKYKFQDIGVKDAPRIPVWIGFRDIIDM